jgi:hypothetical protein
MSDQALTKVSVANWVCGSKFLKSKIFLVTSRLDRYHGAMAALISIILVVLLQFYYGPPSLELFPIIALVGGTAFLLIIPVIRGFIFGSMHSSSVEGSARALTMARKDRVLLASAVLWIAFVLFSFLVAIFQLNSLYFVWIVAFGVAIDAALYFTTRAQRYIDPYGLIEVFSNESKGLFSPKNQKELTYAIDGLAEVGIKGLYQRSIGLTSKAVQGLELLGRRFLKQSPEGDESANFTLVYLLQRLDLIYTQAIEDGLETVATGVVVAVSKLTLAVAEYDPAMAALPLHFLQKFTRLALDRGHKEVAENSSISLFEIAKTLLHEHKTYKKGLGMVMLKIISNMEEVAQETFKEDKNTPIQLLTHPFRELKELLETSELGTFLEKDQVKEGLSRVLAEFEALEAVLQSVPNIPGYQKVHQEKAETPQQ